VIGVCSMIGSSLALGFGGLLNDIHGWRITYYLASVPGLILAMVIFLTIRDPRAQTSLASAPIAAVPLSVALKTLWNRKSYVLLCLGMGIGSIAGYAQQAWNPAFLMRTYHISSGQVGSHYAAVVGTASIVSILLGGVVNDRLARRDQRWSLWIVALSFGLNMPASLAFFLIRDFTLAMVLAVVSTILVGLWVAPAYALVQNLAGTQSRALAAALLMMILNIIGQGLGPAVTGMLSDGLSSGFGNRSLMVSLCIVSMAGAVAVIPFLLATRTVKADLAEANS
jgi:MFS family permease